MKQRGSLESSWANSFSLTATQILIVCRGPVRLEAMEVFKAAGAQYGMLLSEKDSVTYPHTLASELRFMQKQKRVHPISDYSGITQEERQERIAQIIDIAKEHHYTHVFAGYGFMAEDAVFVEALEKAEIGFIGPSSSVHHLAGAKDRAKAIARQLDVSVTPGIDNITAITLLAKAKGTKAGLEKLASQKQLNVAAEDNLEQYAQALLQAAYRQNIGLITTADIQAQAKKEGERIISENPGQRLRLKYIGGGGGKGQRVVERSQQIPNAVQEVLAEAKILGEADNKNFLMELNIEDTHHNEIQLLGNGDWCISLGGRDCSLQMHEQKLVELSLTDELFQTEIALATQEGRRDLIAVLERDRQLLKEMEEQAVRFGKTVKLNSASTFESIVSDGSFFFMEMNTRIQVEHRVTEMVYSLYFYDPEVPENFFYVDSLIEAMALIAVHGKRLPCPRRIKRHTSSGEVRLNAQNDALQPAAGSLIEFWSPPHKDELRDDQGIGIRDPDTQDFIRYHLAGAYDSNIALIVTHGKDRRHTLEALADILRCMEIRGQDLQTNKNFHYGALNFCLGLHPMLKPTTKFVVPYLCAVGSLALELEKIDWNYAWKLIQEKVQNEYGTEGRDILDRKQTLILRPLNILQKDTHACAGWLMRNFNRAFGFIDRRPVWKRNPLCVLAGLYHYTRLEERKDVAPIQKIWEHDQALLQEGLTFYTLLEQRLRINSDTDFHRGMLSSFKISTESYATLMANLGFADEQGLQKQNTPLKALTPLEQEKCKAVHAGWQLGLPLIELLLYAGHRSGIMDIQMQTELRPVFPERFLDGTRQKKYLQALSPLPPHTADIVVAQLSGVFYLRESPGSPPYLEVGQQFQSGDPMYIIEVMKMFNKIYAEFSGTIIKILVEHEEGKIVKKGQPLFRVKPSEKAHLSHLSSAEKEKRRHKYTRELLDCVSI